MATFYRTFKRSCRNWQEFATARKVTHDVGLTYEQARQQCQEFNAHLSPVQERAGTKLEFERMA